MASIDELKAPDGTLDKAAIMKIIPYGESFLFLDTVTELDGKHILATFRADGSRFEGHFAGFPIMPGALIIEGMGQAATLLLRSTLINHEEKDILAYKIKDSKFSAPTFPGDEITFDVQLLGSDDRGAMMQGSAIVNGKKAVEATMMLSIVDRKQFRARHAR